MDRARRAGWTVLIVVAMVVSARGWRRRAGDRRGAVLAAVHARGLGGTDGRCVRVGRVRRARQPGRGDGRPPGLEVVYATSTGSTVTRKATWTAPTILDPGRRILIANAAGAYGALADATYSGGFAATGGAVALRAVGGAAIDAVGWGDATNGVRRGQRGPGAGGRIQPRASPGRIRAGNGTDSNDNVVRLVRAGDAIAAGPRVAAGTGSGRRHQRRLPAARRRRPPLPPTPTPAAADRDADRRRLRHSIHPGHRPLSRPDPTPPTPAPHTTPRPTAPPHADAYPHRASSRRERPDDARRRTVTIEGVLTTALGALESGHGGFVQDVSGGIALYLDDAVRELAGGSTITVEGSLSNRYSQRTLRVSEESGRVPEPTSRCDCFSRPEPRAEAYRRPRGCRPPAPRRLRPTSWRMGSAITIDDGSGRSGTVIGPDALGGPGRSRPGCWRQ